MYRRQLTFEYLDTVNGKLKRADPGRPRAPAGAAGPLRGREDVHFTLEGCTGWRCVTKELDAVRITLHLAEPSRHRGAAREEARVKTDKADARHLRTHLLAGDLPESWIPPEHVLEAQATVRLYKGARPGCVS